MSAVARRERAEWREEFPVWLADDFAARYECRRRWDSSKQQPPSPHPIRPAAFSGFGKILWQSWFEDCDLAAAAANIELRHPYLDLRLLRYMLAVPPMPWCRNKLILRRSMRSSLPGNVLRRRKAPLAEHPDLKRVQAAGFRHCAIGGVVTIRQPAQVHSRRRGLPLSCAALRPLGLNYWLNDLFRWLQGRAFMRHEDTPRRARRISRVNATKAGAGDGWGSAEITQSVKGKNKKDGASHVNKHFHFVSRKGNR